MKIKFSTKKGSRTLNQLSWIVVFTPKRQPSLWWNPENNKWVYSDTLEWKEAESITNHHEVGDKNFPRSYKALLRYLKKHEELKGCEVVVCTRTKTLWQEISIQL